MNFLKSLCTTVCSTLLLSANAHVPFLKPNQFHVLHNRFQVESSFTEYPFQADFAMDAPEYLLFSPKGIQTTLTPTARLKAANYLEPSLTDSGTYRIHAALRKGPLYKAIETIEGKLYFADDMKTKQGKPTTLQYFSSADTYVLWGTQGYITTLVGKGVEIIPQAAPNQINIGKPVQFSIYFNGKPAPSARVVVVYDNEHFDKYRTEDLYDVENVRKSNIIADKHGNFTFTARKAGLVLLFVNIHQKINDSLWESYNSSVSLEVNPAIIRTSN